MKTQLRGALAGAFPYPVAWGEIPQATKGVRIRLTVASGATDYHFGGETIRRARVQVSIMGETYAETDQAAQAVKDYLSGYSDSAAGIQGVFFDNERDLSSVDSGETLFHIAQDHTVHYR